MGTKNRPKISVIMPVYNAEKYLSKSITSVLSQTFADFEFIIIDDASSDASGAIIEKFQGQDKRLKIIKNRQNLGVAACLNLGLSSAQGQYIARQDADDISLPDRLQKQYEYLEKNKHIFLLGSAAIIIDEQGRPLGLMAKKDNYRRLKKILKKTNSIIHPSIMFRQEKNIFYNPQARWCEDFELYQRLLKQGKNLTNLSQPLIKYRIYKQSISSKKGAEQELIMEAVKKWQQTSKETELFSRPPSLDRRLSQNQFKNQQMFFYQRMVKFYLKIGNYRQAKKHYAAYTASAAGKKTTKIILFLFVRLPWLYRLYRKLFFGY